jgi:hypothetical protein
MKFRRTKNNKVEKTYPDQEQSLNTRQNRLVTYKGETKPLMVWARQLDLKYSTLKARLFSYGWTVDKAFEAPVAKRG